MDTLVVWSRNSIDVNGLEEENEVPPVVCAYTMGSCVHYSWIIFSPTVVPPYNMWVGAPDFSFAVTEMRLPC
jgi:hypothetical protein